MYEYIVWCLSGVATEGLSIRPSLYFSHRCCYDFLLRVLSPFSAWTLLVGGNRSGIWGSVSLKNRLFKQNVMSVSCLMPLSTGSSRYFCRQYQLLHFQSLLNESLGNKAYQIVTNSNLHSILCQKWQIFLTPSLIKSLFITDSMCTVIKIICQSIIKRLKG